jgi:hypothetical protein
MIVVAVGGLRRDTIAPAARFRKYPDMIKHYYPGV